MMEFNKISGKLHLKITIYFPYFFKFVYNVLKINLCPVFKDPEILQNRKGFSRNICQNKSRCFI